MLIYLVKFINFHNYNRFAINQTVVGPKQTRFGVCEEFKYVLKLSKHKPTSALIYGNEMGNIAYATYGKY